MYNLKEEMFLKSKAGNECIKYLKTIQNTEIESREAKELSYKYSMLFYKETNFHHAISYIQFTYIPINLFREYNITIVSNKSTDNNIDNNDTKEYINTTNVLKKKTAPTLIEGGITYVLIMIGLSIFNERILGWIVTTIIFVLWKTNEINKYN